MTIEVGGEMVAPEPGLWRAGVVQDFARSELFDHTFEEGMELPRGRFRAGAYCLAVP